MRVLYLDGADSATSGFVGALRHVGARVEFGRPERGLDPRGYDAIVLSDLEHARLGEPLASALADTVREGTGLLATGGPRSFGSGGYAHTPFSQIFPVRLSGDDDTVTTTNGARPLPVARHPLTQGLSFDTPPTLRAYHRFTARGSAQTVLEVAPVDDRPGDAPRSPLLVIGRREEGRVAAFASGLTPPWSGDLTEWGGAPHISLGDHGQVGIHYLTFVTRLVWWVGRGELEPPRAIQAGRVGAGEEPEPATG